MSALDKRIDPPLGQPGYGRAEGVESQQLLSDLTGFGHDTPIATPKGEIAAEALKPGDLVLTADRGLQPVRWVWHTNIQDGGGLDLVSVAQSGLGTSAPFYVAGAQRRLISGQIAQQLGATDEGLLPARYLRHLAETEAHTRLCGKIVQIGLDRHEILFAGGAAWESFYAGRKQIKALGFDGRKSLFEAFPNLPDRPELFGPPARQTFTYSETGRILAA